MALAETIAAETASSSPPSKKPSRAGGCLKGCLIAFVIFLVVGSVAGYFGYKALSKKIQDYLPATGLSNPKAPTLTIDAGTATGASGPLTSGQELSAGDKVTTGPASAATITFPNGSETRLDENTSLMITTAGSSISLFQNLGRSWARVENLAGSDSTFEIETPTALATVRGTAFAVTITGEDSAIDTDTGEVEVAAIERVAGQRKILQKISVDAGNSTSINKSDLEDLRANRKQLVKQAIRQELKDSPWFKDNRDRDLRPRSSPQDLLNLAKNFSPDDLSKFQALSQKINSLTPEQIAQIESIAKNFEGVTDPSQINPAELARILAIIDPENFSDTAHWSQVIGTYLPLLKDFNPLQNLPVPQN